MLQELIPLQEVSFDQGQKQYGVNARELHGFLESNRQFSDWIANRIKRYNFVENVNFVSFSRFRENDGKNVEYFISIERGDGAREDRAH